MANHPSAAKRNRQRIKRTIRNREVRSSVRTAIKKARLALEGGDVQKAREQVRAADQIMARAVSKGVYHRNTASRATSRLHRALHKVASSS